MTVQVIFFKPKGMGSINAPGLGDIRIREAVTIPGTTDAEAEEGECVVVFNGEGAPVLAARGSNPDAAATLATEATTAGVAVPSAQVSLPLVLKTGDKVNVKALA